MGNKESLDHQENMQGLQNSAAKQQQQHQENLAEGQRKVNSDNNVHAQYLKDKEVEDKSKERNHKETLLKDAQNHEERVQVNELSDKKAGRLHDAQIEESRKNHESAMEQRKKEAKASETMHQNEMEIQKNKMEVKIKESRDSVEKHKNQCNVIEKQDEKNHVRDMQVINDKRLKDIEDGKTASKVSDQSHAQEMQKIDESSKHKMEQLRNEEKKMNLDHEQFKDNNSKELEKYRIDSQNKLKEIDARMSAIKAEVQKSGDQVLVKKLEILNRNLEQTSANQMRLMDKLTDLTNDEHKETYKFFMQTAMGLAKVIEQIQSGLNNLCSSGSVRSTEGKETMKE